MATVDVLGLGNGAPMAARRIEAGHPVTVWNRTRSRVAIADSPADAARDVDAVTTMVATPAHDRAANALTASRRRTTRGQARASWRAGLSAHTSATPCSWTSTRTLSEVALWR
jgi:3-hydroxyisobutyrate dehydrogenase-like beta-hydroxyacid dehydrogenase